MGGAFYVRHGDSTWTLPEFSIQITGPKLLAHVVDRLFDNPAFADIKEHYELTDDQRQQLIEFLRAHIHQRPDIPELPSNLREAFYAAFMRLMLYVDRFIYHEMPGPELNAPFFAQRNAIVHL